MLGNGFVVKYYMVRYEIHEFKLFNWKQKYYYFIVYAAKYALI